MEQHIDLQSNSPGTAGNDVGSSGVMSPQALGEDLANLLIQQAHDMPADDEDDDFDDGCETKEQHTDTGRDFNTAPWANLYSANNTTELQLDSTDKKADINVNIINDRDYVLEPNKNTDKEDLHDTEPVEDIDTVAENASSVENAPISNTNVCLESNPATGKKENSELDVQVATNSNDCVKQVEEESYEPEVEICITTDNKDIEITERNDKPDIPKAIESEAKLSGNTEVSLFS